MRYCYLSTIIFGLVCHIVPAFALTVSLPIHGEVGDPPTVVTQALDLGQVSVLNPGANAVGTYTNGICNSEIDTLCIASGQAGVITITAPFANSITLDSLAADANDWVLSNNGGTLSIGVGNASSSYGSSLTTVPLSFGSGLGTCTATLNPGESCVIYVGGQIANIGSATPATHTATVGLILTYL